MDRFMLANCIFAAWMGLASSVRTPLAAEPRRTKAAQKEHDSQPEPTFSDRDWRAMQRRLRYSGK